MAQLEALLKEGEMDCPPSPQAAPCVAVPLEGSIPPPPLPGMRRPPSAADPGKIERTTKIFRSAIIGTVLVTLLITVAVFSSRAAPGPVSLFGYCGMSVRSGSMEPDIPMGTFILVRHTDPALLQVDDDITYRHRNTTRTHRIIGIEESGEGRAFRTKGVYNYAPDSDPVAETDIIGRVVYQNLALGRVVGAVQEKPVAAILQTLAIFGAVAAIIVVVRVARHRKLD